MRINEKQKVTLTLGQLKRLVKEAVSDDVDFEFRFMGTHLYEYHGMGGDVVIPDGVKSIEGRAFKGCKDLTSITIPDSMTTIGSYTFEGCENLTSVHISDLAAWCRIDFGDSTSNPCWYANHLYLNGTEVTDLVIPDTVKSIGRYAFLGCRGLTSVTIPDSVTSIGHSAFYGCSSLKSVTIPDSVKVIKEFAFARCDNLTSVIIPKTAIIDFGAFNHCENLTSVKILNPRTLRKVVKNPDKSFVDTPWAEKVKRGKVRYR